MSAPLSIRWRLVISTVGVACGIAVALLLCFRASTRRHLVEQLEKTLGTKCDEVIKVMAAGEPSLALARFIAIETDYRFSPHTYFYQVSEVGGAVHTRSENLGVATLPIPGDLGADDHTVELQTVADPTGNGAGRYIRVRSERVDVLRPDGGHEDTIIQVAVSLGPVDATMRGYWRTSGLYAACGIAAVFGLAWFVTTRSLRPVAALTHKASKISATNLRARLPLGGTGDEIDELAGVLNAMLDRLEGAMRQMERFTADAAHQLRTPLTRIRGEIDLMLRNGLSADARSQLGAVQEEIERLSRVCARLLFLARLDQEIETGAAFTDSVKLDTLLYDMLEQMAPLACEKGVRMICGPLPTVAVRGSRALLVEAVLNLLHNAVRYTPAGGVITISLAGNNGHVAVAVEDTGPGIAPAERDRIFERFYCGHAEANDGETRTGLGLAIVKGIAEAHGGAVGVDSTMGKGSRFRMTLPAAA